MKSDHLVNFLLERNREQSTKYASPDVTLSRRQYRSKHPTEIAALKCMDGRLNLSVMTETPPGIIQPYRNIGGKFDIGWPYFQHLMQRWVDYAVHRGRNCLVLVTYHFSRGDVHRGCKGFEYDTAAAQASSERLRHDFETVFGEHHQVVYPIRVGIETDEDALILHGENGQVLDLGLEPPMNEDDLRIHVERLYPDMHPQIVEDLIALLHGNERHIIAVRESKRPIADFNHKEFMLGIGRGFDWLHLANRALLVGPYSYDVADPVGKAAGILLQNLQSGRISEEHGVVLMAAGVYYQEAGIDKKLAEMKARSLAKFGMSVIHTQVPELEEYLSVLAGVVSHNTRYFTPIEL